MKNIKKSILITLALLIENGCSGFFNNQKKAHFTSQISLKQTKLHPFIIEDMVNFIKNYYPISKTTFYFQLDTSAYSQGIAIENKLRNIGYGVSYIQKKGRIPFAYKLDFIDKQIMRTTYNIGTTTFSRLYRIETEQVLPISAFTTRGLKQRIYQNHLKQSYNSLQKAIVFIPILNIRNKPSSKGEILGKYYKDTLVYVESSSIDKEGEQWSRVVKKDKNSSKVHIGYIASRYIRYID